MKNLLYKEIKLAASPLSFIFIAFGLMTLIPNYPILCGAFFVTLGIFYSFQVWREADDISYSVLLPIKKSDVVTAKYLFTVFIELSGFVIMAALTVIRMTVLKDSPVYAENVLLKANPVFLAFALTVFGLFNIIFVNGFFKTAYYFAKPFIAYAVAAFLTIGVAETLIHIPGLEMLNSTDGNTALHLIILLSGAVLYVLLTFIAYRASVKRFEKIDL